MCSSVVANQISCSISSFKKYEIWANNETNNDDNDGDSNDDHDDDKDDDGTFNC